MSTTLTAILAVFLLTAVVFGGSVRRAWHAWRGARDVRLVTCPETGQPAAVSLDAAQAASTAFIEGKPLVRLESCSRWETRGHCDEPCVPDVQANGLAAAVHAIVARWYEGKRCVLCSRPIRITRFLDHPPALVGADGTTVEWSDVAPEQLPDLFRNRKPVCWDCHVAEEFRRRFPELVVDRPSWPAHHV